MPRAMNPLTQMKKSTGRLSKEGAIGATVKRIDKGMRNKVNILLVDDHPENILALEAVLAYKNYNLVKAYSGEEALKWVLKVDFAVILLDVQMPGIDGFATAKLIKAREKSKDIPIIFITAISQASEHVNRGYSVGGIDYIFKPFEPEVLRKKVEGFVKIRQTMDKVKEQSEFLRAITEVSSDTIVALNEHGDILSVNPIVREMFGYEVKEVLGELISRLLPEFGFVQGKLFKETRLFETMATRKNGEGFPVDISIGEANVGDQQVFIYSIHDITERKEIEKERKQRYEKLERLVHERTEQIQLAHEKLRLSEMRFRKTFESSPNMMMIKSLINGRYIDVNESWERYTEYRYEDVKDSKNDFYQIAHDSPELNVDSHLIQKHPLHNVRVVYHTKSGKLRHGLLSTEIFEIEGEKCLLSVITDITERLVLEQEMARLDRLDLIGEMAAGIAHEIRNPMTTVRGFLQMMSARSQHAGKNELFDLMIDELDRANSIITEFLALSKNQTLELDKNSLNTLIETLFPLIQADAFNSRKDAQMKLEMIPDIEFDEREIRQMILNLARNGLEAMPSGGTLTLRTYSLSEEVVLEVQDEGSGIVPEILQKIGTPFFTTKEKGTGLGLAVCFGIADNHNARISINTGPKGTTFSVRFPLPKPRYEEKRSLNIS
jgi:two-component system, sporulation sensor kinase E